MSAAGSRSGGFRGFAESELEPTLAAVFYASGVLASRWLGPLPLLFAALITATPLLVGAVRRLRARRATGGRLRLADLPSWFVPGIGLPLHLVLLATGALASPLLPLLAVWVAAVAVCHARSVALGLGIAVLLLMAIFEASTGGAVAPGLIEGALLVGAGWGAERLARSGLLAAGTPTEDRVPAEANAAVPTLPEAWVSGVGGGSIAEELLRLLDRIRETTGATRAVLWDIDEEADRARPAIASGGPPPAPVVLSGETLRWAWEEHVTVRSEQPPTWSSASGGSAIVPLDPDAVAGALLTVEFERDAIVPAADTLETFAPLLRAAVRMHGREAAAAVDRVRLATVVEMLRQLPGRLEGSRIASSFAEAARELADATGALIAFPAGEGGRIGVLIGEDGGPAIDTEYAGESRLGLAARDDVVIADEATRARGRSVPFATPEERWIRAPRAYAIVPMIELDPGRTGPTALLALWTSTSSSLDAAGLAAAVAAAPYAATVLRLSTELQEREGSVSRDPLTDIHNRRSFQQRFLEETKHFQRYRHPLALLMLDADHFKQINDRLGHEAGDAVLRAIAGAIVSSVRESDIVARYGGEEFIVLAREASLRHAVEAAERIRSAVERLVIVWDGQRVPVTMSVGVASCPESVEDPNELLPAADKALYASKAGGRNRVTAG